MNTSSILENIRNLMIDLGPDQQTIEAIILTNNDQHMNANIARRDQVLKYVSGFTGSCGAAVITQQEARLWTDGLHYIQAAKQLDTNYWRLMRKDDEEVGEWLKKALNESCNVGADPKLVTHVQWKYLQDELKTSEISLVPIVNLIDKIWANRPACGNFPIQVVGMEYAGETVASKLGRVWQVMKEKHADALVLSSLDEIAWLLNLRGQDTEFNLVFYSYLIIGLDELILFVDEDKITEPIKLHLKKDHLPLSISCYESFYGILARMSQTVKRVWLDRTANHLLVNTFVADKVLQAPSPVALMKLVKNEAEIKGMINAHIKDGVAVSRYFSWLEKAVAEEEQQLTELSVAQALEKYRQDEEDYVGPSFGTISGVGSNSAMAHYKPTNETNRLLRKNDIYLCDSGSHYLQGTTDVSRTIHFGTPSSFQKECFTRVLLGFISLATVILPFGIPANKLDTLAHRPLWELHLDYNHGTDYGIGAYLNVHENLLIGSQPQPYDSTLYPDMFLSDEPGYYKEGDFGIRIENIMQVVATNRSCSTYPNSELYLAFNFTTLVPIQKKMLNLTLLNDKEINFLNDYHRRVLNTIGPVLQRRNFTDAFEWLHRATTPIRIANEMRSLKA